jgi:hypothetical protein
LLGEVATALNLLQQVLSLCPGSLSCLLVCTLRNCNKDMANLNLLLHLVLCLMLVVVGLHVGIGDLRLATGKIRSIKGRVLNLARLRNRSSVLRSVVFEELLQLSIGRIDALPKILGRDDRIIKLHLGALHFIGIAHCIIRNVYSARDQRLKPLKLHIALDLALKVRAARLEKVLHEVHVSVIANVLAAGEQILRKRPCLKLAAQILVTHLKAQAICLVLKNLALYQNLTSALRHVREQELWQALLLQLARCQLIHLGHLHRGAVDTHTAEDSWLADDCEDIRVVRRGIVKDTRYQSDYHGDRCEANNDSKEYLGDAVVLLQNANHA